MEMITKAIHDTLGIFTRQAPTPMPEIKKGDWILLTGASDFVAAHVLTALLDAGYKVKCTVRSQQKAADIRKLRPLQGGNLDFVVVEDVAVDNAFQEAVKGVTGVIHTAAPFALTDQIDSGTSLLDLAISGTVNILNTLVRHNPDCRRVVITSSFASILDPNKGRRPGYTYTERDWNPVTYDEALHADGAVAYCASKTLAERAAWDFMAKHTPGTSAFPANFSVATICAPIIYGPVEHSVHLKSLDTSIQDIYRLINGSEKRVPETAFYAWADVRDVAVSHLRALEAVPRTQSSEDRYFVVAGTYSHTEICSIIAKRFPHLVNSGLTPNPVGAPAPPLHYSVDNSKSRAELGMTYRSLETCIVDIVSSLLKLQKDETQEAKAPVSVTDVRTGFEQRSRSLVGTGLTVCGCQGNMGVCSCAPNTCACRGCAKKSFTNPTARTAYKGPKPGLGVVPREWRRVPDLTAGVSDAVEDKCSDPTTCTQPNCSHIPSKPTVCDCTDPATCTGEKSGVCTRPSTASSSGRSSPSCACDSPSCGGGPAGLRYAPPKIWAGVSEKDCCCPKKLSANSACPCLPGSHTCPCSGHQRNAMRVATTRECPCSPESETCTCPPECTACNCQPQTERPGSRSGLRGATEGSYAVRLGEKWGVGDRRSGRY